MPTVITIQDGAIVIDAVICKSSRPRPHPEARPESVTKSLKEVADEISGINMPNEANFYGPIA